MNISKQLNNSWKSVLSDVIKDDAIKSIQAFLLNEIENGNIVYPNEKDIFNAFNKTNFNDVKVVILGQDPYHGDRQAHGLSFSVPQDVTQPPSLKNIFKELHNDLGIEIQNNGDLSQWAKQGVLLLNSMLTVRANAPASHRKIGWEKFTDDVIKTISDKKENVVFILWGNFAKSKKDLIDTNKHLIIESVHPSPFSAYNGFFDSKPFSKTNKYLKSKGINEIDW